MLQTSPPERLTCHPCAAPGLLLTFKIKSMKKNDTRHLQRFVKRYSKQLLIMKLTSILLLSCLLQAYSKGYSQPGITLNLKNVELRQVFTAIEKQTDYKFVFNDDVLPGNKKFSINVKDEPIQVLLQELFKGTPFRYKFFDDNSIAIGSAGSNLQQVPITGKVTVAGGTPLAGVTVKVKGSKLGTSTDADGNFSINVPDGATLIFSYVGYSVTERIVKGNGAINITLEQKNQEMNQVVVVGYGTQRKREITGAVSTIKVNDIKDLQVTSIDQALQGKAAGVQVVNNTGAPGSFVQIRIRGTNSLSGSNEPLYVVDGVPINNTLTGSYQAGNDQINGMAGLNPSDIESIDILKDASTASIYGARAANGVVLITTKRGKPGRSVVSFNLNSGVQQQNRRYDLLNGQQYAIMSNELSARLAPNRPPFFSQLPTVNTNWQDEIFQQGLFNNANIALTGGSDKVTYAVTGGLFDQKGTIINSKFRRYSLRSNVDINVNSKIKVGTNLFFSRTVNNRLRNDGGPNFQDAFNGNNVFGPNVLSSALVYNPTIKVYNPDGTYARDSITINSNPVALATEANLVSRNIRVIGNFFGDWQILKDLRFHTNFGIDVRNENEDFFFPPNPAALGSGRASSRAFNENLYVFENTLNYKKLFAAKHQLDVLAGMTVQESNRRSNLSTASGLTNAQVQTVYGPLTNGSSGISANGILSYISRAQYNFDQKYFLTAAARVDASSRFGADKKYAFFPSASAGWIVSDEKFLSNSKSISFLKLRGSYGLTGNQEIGDFSFLGRINLNSPYLGASGAQASNIEDNNYGWETTTQANIGFDVALFNSRATLSVDYYSKKTKNLILDIPLPATTGFGSRPGNVGDLQNTGVDVLLNTENIKGKFRWNTSFNISFNKNKILKLVNGQDIFQGSFGYSNIAREGKELSFFLFQVEDKVDPATGKMVIKDIDKSGGIDDKDRSIVGSPLPKHFGGITNTFAYANFDLNIFFQWSYGNKIYNQTREFIEGYGGGYYNSTTNALRRWKKAGDVTDVPFVGPDNNATGYASTRFLEDGSYLRMKNVSLGYNLTPAALKRIGATSVRIAVSAQNLFTFTNYTGYDPEVNAFTGTGQFNNIAQGFDNGSYPQAKTIVVSLNVNF